MKTYILAITLIIAILAISFTFFFGGQEKGLEGIKKNFLESEETKTDSDSSGVGNFFGGGSGGSSSGSGSGERSTSNSNPQNSPGCERVQISYSLTNIQTNSTCNSVQEDVCTNKDVTCSISVNNLDPQVSGEFTINFQFFNPSNYDLIEERETSSIVSAQSTARFSAIINVQSEGAEGNANQNIYCTFFSTEVPTKEICN